MSSRQCRMCVSILALAVSWSGISFGQSAPNGWIQTSGWNMLLPLLNPYGCSGGGADNMKLNWVAPHDLKSEDPKAGTTWNNIAFGGDGVTGARATGYDLGGLSPDPIWVTNAFLEGGFALPPGSLPNGDVVDFQALVDFINTNVVPAVPGSHNLPSDNVLGIATTYVDNITGGPLEIDVCSASDDSVQVYINNKLVTNVSSCRGTAGNCAETRRAFLPAGKSRITGLVWEGGGGWGMRIGIQLAGTGVNLADGNGMINFIGAGGAGDNGQTQYCLTRTSNASTFNCPNLDVKVTLTGSGPGADGELLTVVEMVLAADPPAISITDVTNGGVVADKLPETTPTPVGDLCDRRVVGSPCAGGSITTAAAGPVTCPVPEYTSVAQTGGDIWDCGDVFEYAYCRVGGDFDVAINMTDKAHSLGSAPNDVNGRWGKFGLMARKSLATDARYTMVQDHLPDLEDAFRAAGRTVQSGCGGMYEDGAFAAAPNGGAGLTAHPKYFRLTRRGNVVQCWASDDGTKVDPCLGGDPAVDDNWSAGHSDDWGEAPKIFLGFANSEHNSGPACAVQTIKFQLIRAEVTLESLTDPIGKTITWTDVSRGTVNGGLMYNVQYNAVGSTTHMGSIPGVAIADGPSSIPFDSSQSGPVGDFDTSHRIGTPPMNGSTTYDVGTDTYTQMSTGNDFWDGGDDGHFAYKLVTGDFIATARVTSVGIVPPVPGSRWGRYGLMARWTCDRNSKYSMVCQTATDVKDEPRHQWRVIHQVDGNTRDNSYRYDAAAGLLANPTNSPWVRLVRVGRAIYSYLSDDDNGTPKQWILLGSDSSTSLPATLLVGMASHNHGSAGTSPLVMTFDKFTCVPYVRESFVCQRGPVIAETDFDFPDGTLPEALGLIRVQGGTTPLGYNTQVLGGRLRMTEDTDGNQRVCVWVCGDGVALGNTGFVIEYDAYMSKGAGGCDPAADPNPADGMTFVAVQGQCADPYLNVPALRGSGGGSLGYEAAFDFSIRNRQEGHPNFAVEADNWVGGGEPGNEPGDGGSPNNDCTWHTGLDVNSSVSSLQTNVDFGVPTTALPDIFGPSGAHFEVSYQRSGRVDAYLSGVDRGGNPVPRTHVLSYYIPKLEGDVLLGFSAGTGGAVSRQEIDNVVISSLVCAEAFQLAGDCNQDGRQDISDIICMVLAQFPGFVIVGDASPGLPCDSDAGNLAILDLNGDGRRDISDIVRLAMWLFMGAGPPVQGEGCFPMPDGLGCSSDPACP